jgi:hypothetical protein
VRAYKFTADDAVSVFTRFPWPVPAGGKPGAWVDAATTAKVCETGVHACRAADLPYWLGRELWEVELGGNVVKAPYKLVASRGRLLRRVAGWPELERPFAEDCAARVRELAVSALERAGRADLAAAMAAAGTIAELAAVAEQAGAQAPALAATLAGYASDCVWDISKGYYAMCAYVAATAFDNWSTGDVVQDMTSDGWNQERARQAGWLAANLGLPEES